MEPSRVTVESLLGQRGWVRALARTLVFDVDRADDVEQDVWLAALRRPPREGGSLRAWFASVVRSRVRDQRRLDAHRIEREAAVARPEATASAADVASSTETHRRLAAALLALEEPYRSAVILRYFEDLPPRDIAARTGVPVETARTRVKRGVERLRERLDADHDGDRRAWCVLVAPLAMGRASKATLAGGSIVAKKTAVLVALVLLALGAGVGVWIAAQSDAAPVVADVPAARPPAEAARPARPGRSQPDEVPMSEAASTPTALDKKPAQPIVAVVDALTRKPVKGAQIVVVRGDGTAVNFFSGGDSRFSLDPSLVGARTTMWAWAPGHARRRLANIVLAAEVLSIVLEPAEPLQLRFVTEAGRALDAAEVRARFGGANASGTVEIVADDALSGDVTTTIRAIFGPGADWHTSVALDGDDASLHLLEGVSKGRWRLFVVRPGATPWLSDPFDADGASGATVTVPLPETSRTRRVRIVADDSRAPLADARLVPWYEFGDDQAFLAGAEFRADAQGVAALPFDPPHVRGGRRPPTWWVRAPGRVGMFSASMFDDSDVADPVDVAVPRSVTVEGEAYLPSGMPASGLRVVAAQKGLVSGDLVGAEGHFRMTDVPARDGAVDLMLLAGDTFTQTRAPVGPDGVAHAVIGAKAAAGTRGRITGVVTSGGAPLAGVLVVDQPTGAKGGFVRTDAAGRFALDGLDVAVTHDLVVYAGDPQADDSYHRIRTASALRLDPAKSKELAFDLPAGAVRVKVIDADTGKAVAAARVLGGPVDGASESARFAGFDYRAGWAGFTGDDGTLVLRAMVPGASHIVRAHADGYEAAERDGVVPGTVAAPVELEIRLKRK